MNPRLAEARVPTRQRVPLCPQHDRVLPAPQQVGVHTARVRAGSSSFHVLDPATAVAEGATQNC